jgi:hypothetical protein
MHGEIPVGCITAANLMNLLIIDFDFRRWRRGIPASGRGGGNEQEVKTESWHFLVIPPQA